MTPGVRGWIVLFILAAFALTGHMMAARGAPGHTHDGAAGRFYQTWMMPDARHVSCCHDQDCAPAASRQDPDGTWWARWDGEAEWVRIPDGKVERDRDTPDGRSHMCGRRQLGAVTVFCFISGGGA